MGATLHRDVRASHYHGLSCCGAQAPDAQAQQLWLTGLVAPRHVGSSQTRARTRVPCIGRQILNHCATREAPGWTFYSCMICNIIHWSFGDFGSLSYADLPNVDSFHHTISKISSSLILSLFASGSILHIRIQVFQNSNFCLKVQILTLARNTVGCFPWRTLTLFISEKISVKYSSLKNHTLSVVLSNKNATPWEKWLVQLETQLHQCFSSRQPLYFYL